MKDVSPQLSFLPVSILEKLFQINWKTCISSDFSSEGMYYIQIAFDILKFTYFVSYSDMCGGKKKEKRNCWISI